MLLFFEFSDKIFMEISLYLMLFLSVIIATHYFYSNKPKSLLHVLMGNISFSFFFLSVIFSIEYREYGQPALVGFFDLTTIILFTVGALSMFKIRVPIKRMISLSVMNVIIILLFDYLGFHFGSFRFVTSFLVFCVSMYLIIKLVTNPAVRELKSFGYSILVIGIFSVFKLVLAIYRLITSITGLVWLSKDMSINMMTFLSVCLIIWLNYTVVFLTNDYLRVKVEKLSKEDFLTKLPNRRYLMERLDEYYSMSERGLLKFGVVMLDIDGFKDVNDEFGHLVGDEALSELAALLKDSVRTIDFVGRYGGEEFLMVIQSDTETGVSVLLDRLFKDVEETLFTSKKLKLSLSGGVVIVDQGKYESIDEIVDVVDEKMYEAKAKGKNRIIY